MTRRQSLLGISSLASLLLLLGAEPAAPQTANASTTADRNRGADCTGLRGGQPLVYRNPRYGFTMTYPSTFALDPGSVPKNRDSAQFWTPDRRATAVVTGFRNGMSLSLNDLLRASKRDVVEQSRGVITYERAKDDWFVVSGIFGDRIFYDRTFLSDKGRVIGSLWIEFPRTMRPCFEDAVTMMSLSFRQAEP